MNETYKLLNTNTPISVRKDLTISRLSSENRLITPTGNNITALSNNFSVFADDTSLLLKSCRDVYHNTFITELNKVMDWFKLNKLLLNYKKSQYIFFGPHYTIQYKPEFLLQDLYEVCPHYLLLSEEYTDLEEQLADDSLQRTYVKGEPLLKDLYEVAPYYYYP